MAPWRPVMRCWGQGKSIYIPPIESRELAGWKFFIFFSILLPGSFTCVRANVRERFGGPERGGSRYFDGVSIKDALAGAATIGTLARAECWPT